MRVYRIENVQGLGPYHALPYQVELWSDRNHELIECAPSPAKDGIRIAFDEYGQYRFGFSSLEQLHSWFSPYELDKLAELHFNLVIYEVSEYHVKEGRRQIAFRHIHAIANQSMPLRHYVGVNKAA